MHNVLYIAHAPVKLCHQITSITFSSIIVCMALQILILGQEGQPKICPLSILCKDCIRLLPPKVLRCHNFDNKSYHSLLIGPRVINDQNWHGKEGCKNSYWTKTNKVKKYAYLAVPVVPRRFRTEVPAADLIGPDFSVFCIPV